ncbi:MAG: hypothetical protein WKF96_21965 [Solirubrobacteraceae bacterium]
MVVADEPGHLRRVVVLEACVAEFQIDEGIQALEIPRLEIADAPAADLGVYDQASGLLGDDQREPGPVDGRACLGTVDEAPQLELVA